MVKSIISILIASIAVIFLQDWLRPILDWVLHSYQSIVQGLQFIFASNDMAHKISQVIPLFLIPLVIMGAAWLIHFGLRRRHLPWMNEVLWTVWLVLAILVIY